jgi:hypothetical protein
MEWIIYLGALGALLQYVPQWEWFLNLTQLNRKPFNCPLCFTWWSSLIGLTLFTQTPLWETIFISAGASVLAELLWRKLMTI